MKIVPSTWLNDDEFVGIGTRTRRYSPDGGKTFIKEEVVMAVYGWSKHGKSFSIYLVDQGAIRRIGTAKRELLLDFRKVTV